MASRLKKHYNETVIPALTKEFGYSNANEVPKVDSHLGVIRYV